MRKVIPAIGILLSSCVGFYACICVLAPSVRADPRGTDELCDGVVEGMKRGAVSGNAAAGLVGTIFGSVFGGLGGVLCVEPTHEPKPVLEGRSTNLSQISHRKNRGKYR
jgi:hypothetical protein